jgi:threonine dehydratase
VTQPPLIDLAEITAAAALLSGVAVLTPVQESRWLSEIVGGQVLLKCENLQRTGSFKIRGAFTRMSRLEEAERALGVVAGNHAQGVALAARMLGLNARVYMPFGAPIPKVNATRGYGAEIVFAGATVDEALLHAAEYAEQTGATLVHPFDHRDIVLGQGTCGLEILDQVPSAATVLVPTGGGGLIAGVAAAIKAARPDVQVVGVQAEGAAAYPGSLAAGRPVALETMSTMADGIAVARPGAVPFAIIEACVDTIVTVSEESISRALVLLLERAKLVVEPAGAAAVAALLEDPTAYRTPAVAVLSGGNVDPLLLAKLVQHGLAAAGRYLNITVRIPDRPGGLARLLGELAEQGANVLEVAHARTSGSLSPDEVDVQVQLETRGPEHTEEVLARLREHGYRVDSTQR